MTLQENIIEKLGNLPVHRQIEVLDFIEFLLTKDNSKQPLKDPRGMLAGLGIDITAEDIAEARQAMLSDYSSEKV